jgi:hypothetical protein
VFSSLPPFVFFLNNVRAQGSSAADLEAGGHPRPAGRPGACNILSGALRCAAVRWALRCAAVRCGAVKEGESDVWASVSWPAVGTVPLEELLGCLIPRVRTQVVMNGVRLGWYQPVELSIRRACGRGQPAVVSALHAGVEGQSQCACPCGRRCRETHLSRPGVCVFGGGEQTGDAASGSSWVDIPIKMLAGAITGTTGSFLGSPFFLVRGCPLPCRW